MNSSFFSFIFVGDFLASVLEVADGVVASALVGCFLWFGMGVV